jgi:hypothetical protein
MPPYLGTRKRKASAASLLTATDIIEKKKRKTNTAAMTSSSPSFIRVGSPTIQNLLAFGQVGSAVEFELRELFENARKAHDSNFQVTHVLFLSIYRKFLKWNNALDLGQNPRMILGTKGFQMFEDAFTKPFCAVVQGYTQKKRHLIRIHWKRSSRNFFYYCDSNYTVELINQTTDLFLKQIFTKILQEEKMLSKPNADHVQFGYSFSVMNVCNVPVSVFASKKENKTDECTTSFE